MNALSLVDAVAARLVAQPPGDIPADYIAGYFARNREALAARIQPRLDALSARRAAPAPEPPPADGRGPRVEPERAARGQRVVLPTGEHGEITRVLHFTTTVGRPGEAQQVEHSTYIDVRLDSGRVLSSQRELYAERGPPPPVAPDPSLDGQIYLAPAEAWRQLRADLGSLGYWRDKAARARTEATRKQHADHTAAHIVTLRKKYARFAAWRERHPQIPVPDWSALDDRRLALELRSARSPAESAELTWLTQVPPDWRERWAVGDPVTLQRVEPAGLRVERGWRVQAVDGEHAELRRGDERTRAPLWMLQRDRAAPAERPPETFAEPRYLMSLAREMLVKDGGGSDYPGRGAVSQAVKRYLAEHGLSVSTHVNRGSMVSSIDLRPPGGRWTAAQINLANRLLLNLGAHERGAHFEPWQTEGEPYDPYADYPGKGPGLMIPAEHIPRFAAILAESLRGAGQTLSRMGEERLAAGSGPASPAGPSERRGGATAEQRQQAAEGCQDLSFDLPGYGLIRVVCGQQGRRDIWHNVWIGEVRYGFNGARWAKGMKPPEEVLEAIRGRKSLIVHDM